MKKFEQKEVNYLCKKKTKIARITVTRNYEHLSRPNNNLRSFPVAFSDGPKVHMYGFKTERKLTDKSEYYYGGDKNILYQTTQGFKEITTDKEKHIKKYYGNPFARVYIDIEKFNVYKIEDILHFSHLTLTKTREFNMRYFLTVYTKKTISINLKTGNFTVRTERKNGKERKVTFRKNSFKIFYITMRDMFGYERKDKTYYQDVKKAIEEATNIPFEDHIKFCRHFSSFFINKRKIKVPDNFYNLLINAYPTEKFLKKNDRKLVSAITDRLNIKTKLTNKWINIYADEIHLTTLFQFSVLFGDDFYKYLSDINPQFFLKNNVGYRNEYIDYNRVDKKLKLTKKEKQAMLSVINDKLSNKDNYRYGGGVSNLLQNFMDHYKMMHDVKEYFPDLKFRATTLKTFNDEHMEVSRLMRKINQETTIEFVFPEETIKTIEEDIISFKTKKDDEIIVLKPVLLKTQDEYIDEGEFMHHCVGGYVNFDGSIIVSLRTEDSKDRITNEFKVQNGYCVQSRHFNNQNPPEYFEHGLELLKDRILDLARLGLLQYTDKKRVPLKVNGKEVKPRNQGAIVQEDIFGEQELVFDNF